MRSHIIHSALCCLMLSVNSDAGLFFSLEKNKTAGDIEGLAPSF